MTLSDPARLKSLDIPAPTRALLADVAAARDRNADAIANPSTYLEEHLGTLAAIDSVRSAGRLEGISVPAQRLEELAVGPAGPAPRGDDEHRLKDYRYAREWVHRHGADLLVAPDLLRDLHTRVRAHFPGAGWWRSPEAEAEAARYCAGYARAIERGVDPLVAAAALTLDFAGAQPFERANDRVGLLLAQAALYRCGVGVQRFISVERLIERSRGERDRALAGGILPWLAYLAGLVRGAYAEFEARSAGPAPAPEPGRPAPRKPTPGKAEPRGALTAAVLAAIDAFPGRFTFKQLRAACPAAGADLVRKVLKRLKKEGRVRCLGLGHDALWEKVDPGAR